MKKCDFCNKSTPDGKCYWANQDLRVADCEKAIKRMTKSLSSQRLAKENEHDGE